MNFTPKSEDEIQRENLLPEGAYPFKVIKAEASKSKKGNDMIAIQIRVFADDGSQSTVFDYLLEAMAFKLRHFCEEVGLLDKYEAGTLEPEDCEQREGMVQLEIQEADGAYRAKNNVVDYGAGDDAPSKPVPPARPPARTPAQRPATPKDPDLDVAPDDIPFLIPFIASAATALQFLC